MTEAPVLTKKQQKSSLAAKKTKTKETIKNVLATPYRQYWPRVIPEDYKTLKNGLEYFLPWLVLPKINIPCGELKKVPKAERYALRQKLLNDALSEREYSGAKVGNRDGLILGINDVSKALENRTATSVLITQNVSPRLMVQHLIDQAIGNNVPLLVVPNLRHILKSSCGISSIAVAFENCERYECLQNIIKEIAVSYPVPDDHIHNNRLHKSICTKIEKIDRETNSDMESIQNKVIHFVEDDHEFLKIENKVDIPCELNNKSIHIEDDYASIKKENEAVIPNECIPSSALNNKPINLFENQIKSFKLKIKKEKNLHMKVNKYPNKSIYLFRTDKTKRAFVPKETIQNTETVKSKESEGFIAFTDSNETYKGLHVKRVKQDKKRNKRKNKKIKTNHSNAVIAEPKYSLL